MKPNIFIGSSLEQLDTAIAIQQNLEYDSNPTVWNQGIFNLSKSALDDLISALSNFHFAIFVFTPDDITQIRNSSFNTVRDNVVFELGLFIGRLGKERVFFLIPRDTKDFHLPTDLISIASGTYNSKREDKNLIAATAPFCQLIKQSIKLFLYQNFEGLEGENSEAKRLAIEKPKYWEHQLFSELLDKRLLEIRKKFQTIENETAFVKTRKFNGQEFFDWFQETIEDIKKFATVMSKLITEELDAAFGLLGVAGSVEKIKEVADNLYLLCQELLRWEIELAGIKPPEQLLEVENIVKGWSKKVFEEIHKFQLGLKEIIIRLLNGTIKELKHKVTIHVPPLNAEITVKIFTNYFISNGIRPVI